MAAINIFLENVLFGAGAEMVYKTSFHSIGIHSLWALMLAAAGFAGVLPALLVLVAYLRTFFQIGDRNNVIAAMICLFFGLNLINLFPWWYALILILCIGQPRLDGEGNRTNQL